MREVVKVDGPDGKGGKGSLNDLTKIKLTFDKAIPEGVQVNQHAVENITYTPNVKIRGKPKGGTNGSESGTRSRKL